MRFGLKILLPAFGCSPAYYPLRWYGLDSSFAFQASAKLAPQPLQCSTTIDWTVSNAAVPTAPAINGKYPYLGPK